MELDILKEKKVSELREILKTMGIRGGDSMRKKDILALFAQMQRESEGAGADDADAETAPAEKTGLQDSAAGAETTETQPESTKKRRGRPPKSKKAEEKDSFEKSEPVKAKEDAPETAEPPKTEEKDLAEPDGASDHAENTSDEAVSSKKNTRKKKKTPEDELKAASVETPVKASEASEADPEGIKTADAENSRTSASEEQGPAVKELKSAAEEQLPVANDQKSEPEEQKSESGEKKPNRYRFGSKSEQKAAESPKPEAQSRTEATKEPSPEREKPEAAAGTPGLTISIDANLEAEETKQAQAEPEKPRPDNRYETTGILEIAEGGFGFLRFNNFLTSDQDVYVAPQQIRRFNLKTGDEICGIARKPSRDERFGALLYVNSVNGDDPGTAIRRREFADLTPVFPNERIRLENGSSSLAMRLTDLVAPIGKGQRGLIVAPPKAGKTTLLKAIASAIEKQNVDAELIVLLIDERPEEVTDMQRSINGRVIYSTFDEQPQHHVKVAEMTLARAMRLVEHKKDVIILLDSITRLARAYNLVEPPSGRTLSGGLDPAALYKPKKFFGAARNIEEGGSITILATALIETGSRMDDMIFEEFKGTGNMELHLDRNLSERRIFPALNLPKSGTRREDMLMTPEELEAVYMMRRAVADMGVEDATEKVIFDLVHTKNNKDFVERFRKMRL